jgi:hypothetical protein
MIRLRANETVVAVAVAVDATVAVDASQTVTTLILKSVTTTF